MNIPNKNKITIKEIHNYCQVGYQFLIELTEDELYFGKGYKFYIVNSKIDNYDFDDINLYFEEREYKDYNNTLNNDDDYEKDNHICVNYTIDDGRPYNFKVLKIIK